MGFVDYSKQLEIFFEASCLQFWPFSWSLVKLEANSGSKKAQYGTVPSLKGACLKGSAAARPKAVQKVAEICILHRHTIPVQPKRGDDGKIGIGACRLCSSLDIVEEGATNPFLSNQHFGGYIIPLCP